MFNKKLERRINALERTVLRLETKVFTLQWDMTQVKNNLLVTIPIKNNLLGWAGHEIKMSSAILLLLDHLNLKITKTEAMVKFETSLKSDKEPEFGQQKQAD